MSQRARVMVLIVGLVVLVVAFLIFRPSDDHGNSDSVQTISPSKPSTTTSPVKPKPILVRAVDLKPVDGVKTITAEKGDTVHFTVTSDKPENVHLHGYDVEKAVSPGNPARFEFKANLEGIFEVELENSGEPLVELKVTP